MPLAFLLRYWKYAAGAIVLVAVAIAWHHQYTRGVKAGKAAEHALWVADTAARDKAAADAIAQAQAKADAAKAANEKIEVLTNEKLAAIDRADSLSGMLNHANSEIRRLAASEATGQLGISVATGIATRAEEARRAIESQYDRYDRACQRDAVRFQALQDQIRPQL